MTNYKQTVEEVNNTAKRYALAHSFLCELRLSSRELTPQQIRSLRIQALNGDIDGAEAGLLELMGRREG